MHISLAPCYTIAIAYAHTYDAAPARRDPQLDKGLGPYRPPIQSSPVLTENFSTHGMSMTDPLAGHAHMSTSGQTQKVALRHGHAQTLSRGRSGTLLRGVGAHAPLPCSESWFPRVAGELNTLVKRNSIFSLPPMTIPSRTAPTLHWRVQGAESPLSPAQTHSSVCLIVCIDKSVRYKSPESFLFFSFLFKFLVEFGPRTYSMHAFWNFPTPLVPPLIRPSCRPHGHRRGVLSEERLSGGSSAMGGREHELGPI